MTCLAGREVRLSVRADLQVARDVLGRLVERAFAQSLPGREALQAQQNQQRNPKCSGCEEQIAAKAEYQ